jgi:hypothetical protein
VITKEESTKLRILVSNWVQSEINLGDARERYSRGGEFVDSLSEKARDACNAYHKFVVSITEG